MKKLCVWRCYTIHPVIVEKLREIRLAVCRSSSADIAATVVIGWKEELDGPGEDRLPDFERGTSCPVTLNQRTRERLLRFASQPFELLQGALVLLKLLAGFAVLAL